MKKTLLLLGLGTIFCSSVAYAAPRQKESPQVAKFEKARKMAAKINAKNAASQDIWRAGLITNYFWDDEEWFEAFSFQCSYYPSGLLREEYSEEGFKNAYEYDEEGRLSKLTVYNTYGEQEEVESISSFEYDTVVKDFLIFSSEDYVFLNWSYGYGKEITRNELGNVTMVRGYGVNNGEKQYQGDCLIIEYGEDQKAIKITDQYSYQHWETGEEITEVNSILDNIVWESTDGQILDINLGDPLSPAFTGVNKIASCNCIDSEFPSEALLHIDYTDNGYNCVIELTTGEKISEIIYTSLDDNGSYKYYMSAVDYDEEDGEFYIDSTNEMTYTYVVDKFGLILEESEIISEHSEEYGDDEYSDEMRGEVTYDEVYGYPLEYVASSKSDDDEDFVLREKVVYSNYINLNDPSGIQNIIDSTEEVQFFNLNGVRVTNPTNGIFIRRQGDKVNKVLVK